MNFIFLKCELQWLRVSTSLLYKHLHWKALSLLGNGVHSSLARELSRELGGPIFNGRMSSEELNNRTLKMGLPCSLENSRAKLPLTESHHPEDSRPSSADVYRADS